jgi:hypothetical protein
VLEKLAQLKVHARGREASLALQRSSEDSKATTSGDSISLGEVLSMSSKADFNTNADFAAGLFILL